MKMNIEVRNQMDILIDIMNLVIIYEEKIQTYYANLFMHIIY